MTKTTNDQLSPGGKMPPRRRRVQKHFTKPSLTKQSSKDECNINKIMARYEKTGIIDHLQENHQFGDFSALPDYQESLNFIQAAQALFDDLPADVRKHFNNDPETFLNFAENPENKAGLQSLGLLPPNPAPDIIPDKPVANLDTEPENAPAPSQEPTDSK